MSLKAKLEAVIYAAEEPVTLAQLAMLFAHDAFAWKAERDAQIALEIHPEASPSPESPDDIPEDILDTPLDAPARESTPEDTIRTAALLAELTERVASAESVAEEPKPADATRSVSSARSA